MATEEPPLLGRRRPDPAAGRRAAADLARLPHAGHDRGGAGRRGGPRRHGARADRRSRHAAQAARRPRGGGPAVRRLQRGLPRLRPGPPVLRQPGAGAARAPTAGRPRRSSSAAAPSPAAAAWRSSAPGRPDSSARSRWPAAARSCCSTRATRSADSSPSRRRLRIAADGERCWTSTRGPRCDGVELRLGRRRSRADDLAGFDEVVIADRQRRGPAGACRASSARCRRRRRSAVRLSGRSLLVVDDGFGWWPCASAVELGVRAGFETITVATPAAAFGGVAAARGPRAAARAPARRAARGPSVHGARPASATDGADAAEHDVGRRRARGRPTPSSWSASASRATGARSCRAPGPCAGRRPAGPAPAPSA